MLKYTSYRAYKIDPSVKRSRKFAKGEGLGYVDYGFRNDRLV